MCRSTGVAWLCALGLVGCGGGGSDPDVDAPPGPDDDASTTSVVTQLAAGSEHSCARFSNGEVRCWGRDREGQVGNGGGPIPAIDPVAPVVVIDRDVVAVTAGDEHTCVVLADGGVRCWGEDSFGQLGNGPGPNDAQSPASVPGVTGASAIAAGAEHTCAVLASGGVKCWGRNNSGQLGNDDPNSSEYEPVDVVGLTGAVAVAAGAEHTCAIVQGGAMRCWGNNGYGQLGNDQVGGGDQRVPVDVIGLGGAAVAVAAAGDHTCAVLDSGALRCWGFDMNGQLGNATAQPWETLPGDVVGIASGASAVAAGAGTTCAIAAGGAVRCWGSDRFGQLGDGAPAINEPMPVNVAGLAGGAVAIAVGGEHACAALDTGEVRCWGSNAMGQIARPWVLASELVPVAVAGLDQGVSAVAAGNAHTWAVQGGAPFAWGHNYYGQLAFGGQLTLNDHNAQPVPAMVTTPPPIATFAPGGGHTCGLTPTGGVVCWGANLSGQIGNGAVGDRAGVSNVVGLDTGIAAVESGDSHTCAMRAVGTVACWGSNGSLQSGNFDPATNQPTPNNIPGVTTAIALAAGLSHNCAVVTGDTVKCWGANEDGQLGDGMVTDRFSAVDVIGLTDVAGLALGGRYSCARTNAGGVKCWGANNQGQLGDGTTMPRLQPVDVVGLTTGVDQLVAGAGHTCALVAGGAVQCWGMNVFGQLGDGSTTQRNQPVPVSLPGPAAALAAGFVHTCALLASGALYCWGTDEVGQLGNDTSWGYGNTPVPIAVAL
jgi:alpha-tubulin suppressor-like RCC1 family protein